jgi:hypothetical protein
LTDKHIGQLWGRMAAMYGHKWTSNYGDADDGTWLSGLVDLSPADLADGLRACLKRTDPWPPTLPEFRQLCRPRREAIHREFKALPRPEGWREKGLAALQKIREALA